MDALRISNDPPKSFPNVSWHSKTSEDMLRSLWLNLDLGGCSKTRVMTIFVFHVDPHFPNIGYFEVYGGI